VLALCAAALALIALPGQSALGAVVEANNLMPLFEAGVSPTKLPKTTPAPIALKASFPLKTATGSDPPPLKSLTLEFDKHGQLYTQGLPTCSAAILQRPINPASEPICHNALVGSGEIEAVVERPETPPLPTTDELFIFNGRPSGGIPTVTLEIRARVPALTYFFTEGVIGHHSGPFGTSLTFNLPTVVDSDGYFSVTSINFSIHKRWKFSGKKRSYLLASCPTGNLVANARLAFADGTTLSDKAYKACQPIG